MVPRNTRLSAGFGPSKLGGVRRWRDCSYDDWKRRGANFLCGMGCGAGSALVVAIRGESNVSAIWEEISGVAAGVVRTAFKDVCPCRLPFPLVLDQ